MEGDDDTGADDWTTARVAFLREALEATSSEESRRALQAEIDALTRRRRLSRPVQAFRRLWRAIRARCISQ